MAPKYKIYGSFGYDMKSGANSVVVDSKVK